MRLFVVIDEKGFRANVGMILCNGQQQLFWAERIRQKGAWQFPQGGVQNGETPTEAMYRELHEEVGLMPEQVALLAETQDWLYYRLPKPLVRKKQKPLCIGQKQKWFLLRLLTEDDSIQLSHSATPEFIQWRWVDYWEPVKQVVNFKREVYQQALVLFEPILFPHSRKPVDKVIQYSDEQQVG